MVFENPSSYLTFRQSTITEWDFLRYMAEETGCGLLLDVNNVYVSGFNNEFDPFTYINSLPHDRIVQMHIAGHQHCGSHIIDTHDRSVVPDVWQLFSLAWQLTGGVATLLEWDSQIPEFDEYHAELLKAKQYMEQLLPSTKTETTYEYSSSQISNPVDFMVTDMLQAVSR